MRLSNPQNFYHREFGESDDPDAFFAHPENLLLRMIVDERKHIRELGFRKIIKAKTLVSKTELISSFRPPKVNFQANDYIETIDWNTTALTPPPLLRRVSDDEVWAKNHCR